MRDMRILLIGSTGQVGRHLRYLLGKVGTVIAPIQESCDLLHPDTVVRCFDLVKPTLVVNAAAYTDVQKAEEETDLCRKVNVDGTVLIAEQCKKHNSYLIHYSSDYVFDGYKFGISYRETEEPNPLNQYGLTKYESEMIVQNIGIPHLIFRTQWVYDSRGNNFVTKIISQLKNGEIFVVGDQFGVPNSAYSVADYTVKALLSRKRIDAVFCHSGIYHLSCNDHACWYNFATEIVKRVPKDKRGMITISYLATCQLSHKVWKENKVQLVRRPLYSVLNNGKFVREFKVEFEDWKTIFNRDIVLR